MELLNYLPDFVIRVGIRRLCAQRLKEITYGDPEDQQEDFYRFIDDLKDRPLAENTAEANEQHYEIPAEFYDLVLGKNYKYSCCYYEDPETTLDQAEIRMLELTMERADLKDKQNILELGCGWGSLTVAMARKFPAAQITAVSNSGSQKQWIEKRLAAENLTNVNIITRDINDFEPPEPGKYDRIVSVEMFEHVRNYPVLFAKLTGWLKPGGKLFTHVFAHRAVPYLYEVRDKTDWMSKYFFTGGTMPSLHLFPQVATGLVLERQWLVSGRHYQRTAEDWLKNMDREKKKVRAIFNDVYGPEQAARWVQYWRVFFMACAELFGFHGGREWLVSHYLFRKPE